MSSLSRMVAAVLVMSLACVAQTTIKVCADPDNLPYSNRRLQGYENKIAQLIIADLKAKPAFSFTRQRRGFIRSQFNKHACDLITGVPAQFRPVLTTEPYLRSFGNGGYDTDLAASGTADVKNRFVCEPEPGETPMEGRDGRGLAID